MFQWTREKAPEAQFLFCPTPYCGRMAERQLGGPGYLEIIGRELQPEIGVFWTGPEIISRVIRRDQLPTSLLRRKPVIWDNLHANDYDRSRFFCGPYSGREEILGEISGILSNPNNEFPLNYIPLKTLAVFLQSTDAWDARSAFAQALAQWAASFGTMGEEIHPDALRLFADCHYLPHEAGPDAESFLRAASSLVLDRNRECLPAVRRGIDLLKQFCARATELRDRRLFYALAQRIWDLREELELLERAIEAGGEPFRSDFHLPGTYRGGLVRRLQTLTLQAKDGSFRPNTALS
jgi:protein O-GlcNAcase/histone acetyltransferase